VNAPTDVPAVGFITVGQSPCRDMVSEMTKTMKKEVRAPVLGTLDGLSREEIAALRPAEGAPRIVTRLGSGEAVVVRRDAVEKREDVVFEAANPYGDLSEVERAAARLRESGADLAVLDCMGYDLRHKATVRATLRRPCMLSRTVAARVAAELLPDCGS